MMRKPDPLTVTKVFDTFRLIAKVTFFNFLKIKSKNFNIWYIELDAFLLCYELICIGMKLKN